MIVPSIIDPKYLKIDYLICGARRVNKLLHLSPCAASFLFLVDHVEAVAIVFAKMVLKSSVIIIIKG
jgi:hypothetical protein